MSICENKIKIYDTKKFNDILEEFEKISEFDMFTDYCITGVAKNDMNLLKELKEMDFMKETTKQDYLYLFGTKWVDFEGVEEREHMLTIQFESAYSPPIPFVELLSLKYGCSIDLSYSEPMSDKAGLIVFVSGYKSFEREMNYYQYRYTIENDFQCLKDLLVIYPKDYVLEEISNLDISLTAEEKAKLLEFVTEENDLKK